MNRTIAACLLTLSLFATPFTPLFAHDTTSCPYMNQASADKKLKTLTKKLSLSKDQQGQVKAILNESMSGGEGRMSPEQCAAMDNKIESVLNDAQKTKYEKMARAEGKGEAPACCMPVSKTK